MIVLADYSYWVALGALFLQCATAYLLVEHFFLTEKYLAPYIGRFALSFVLFVGIVASALSLIYSEHFGFIPCGLCWLERGFLYTITILSATAIWRVQRGEKPRGGFARPCEMFCERSEAKEPQGVQPRYGVRDAAIADYGIVLSSIGALVALYHHYGQITGGTLAICPTSGGDCARRLVFEFGYVTLPLMSFTTFVFFIAVFLIYRRWHAQAA